MISGRQVTTEEMQLAVKARDEYCKNVMLSTGTRVRPFAELSSQERNSWIGMVLYVIDSRKS